VALAKTNKKCSHRGAFFNGISRKLFKKGKIGRIIKKTILLHLTACFKIVIMMGGKS
jgi:hypothetical protein